MRKAMIVTVLIAAYPLGACGEQPKSIDYFKAHLDEARDVAARCSVNGDAGENCGNAAVAITQAGREQFDADRARTQKNLKDGSIWPKIGK